MNVRELKKMLEKYPDDMKIIHTYSSDYVHVEEATFSVRRGVDQGNYVMEPHRTMSAANKAKEESFLHIHGN